MIEKGKPLPPGLKGFHYSSNEGRFEPLITTIIRGDGSFKIVISEPLVFTLDRALRKQEQREWEQY